MAHLIKSINDYAAAFEGFWVCAVAKDAWPVLINHLDELHPNARPAVEHYASEQPS